VPIKNGSDGTQQSLTPPRGIKAILDGPEPLWQVLPAFDLAPDCDGPPCPKRQKTSSPAAATAVGSRVRNDDAHAQVAAVIWVDVWPMPADTLAGEIPKFWSQRSAGPNCKDTANIEPCWLPVADARRAVSVRAARSAALSAARGPVGFQNCVMYLDLRWVDCVDVAGRVLVSS